MEAWKLSPDAFTCVSLFLDRCVLPEPFAVSCGKSDAFSPPRRARYSAILESAVRTSVLERNEIVITSFSTGS
jgi:hypothetical protein